MASSRRARFVALSSLVARLGVENPRDAISSGRVLVDGRVISKPTALVRSDAAVRVAPERRLRGDIKLSHALDQLDVPVTGRVAVDLGASAGGFTTALLSRGARRVYAVDVGVGQLRGRLRCDPRVVNLEGVNVASLNTDVIADVVELVTLDVGYLSLAEAFRQVERFQFGPKAHLVALLKPTFELRRASLAASDRDVAEATSLAVGALSRNGWTFLASCPAPSLGRGRAREVFLHGRRGRAGRDA